METGYMKLETQQRVAAEQREDAILSYEDVQRSKRQKLQHDDGGDGAVEDDVVDYEDADNDVDNHIDDEVPDDLDDGEDDGLDVQEDGLHDEDDEEEDDDLDDEAGDDADEVVFYDIDDEVADDLDDGEDKGDEDDDWDDGLDGEDNGLHDEDYEDQDDGLYDEDGDDADDVFYDNNDDYTDIDVDDEDGDDLFYETDDNDEVAYDIYDLFSMSVSKCINVAGEADDDEDDAFHFNKLPEELFPIILNKFNLEQKVRMVPLVCKKWYNLWNRESALWRTMDFISWQEDEPDLCVPSIFNKLSKRARPFLRELHFDFLIDRHLSYVLRRVGHGLERLTVLVTNVDDEWARNHAHRLPNCKYLNLCGCDDITDVGVEALCQHCPSLTFFHAPPLHLRGSRVRMVHGVLVKY